MPFNSIEFAAFLPAAFAAYWLCARNARLQNLCTVAAGWVFYGWWDWRFLSLIAFTSAWSWGAGLLERSRAERGLAPSRVILASSCIVNLGILAAFKYWDFFAAEAAAALSSIGFRVNAPLIGVLLPAGVSFYTFQALSYTIDAYRRRIVPVRDPVAFFAYISFFPQLVAGPIERATDLLPQFLAPRSFRCDEAVVGLRQALWGFFKKCVVADNCAVVADALLAGPADASCPAAWAGTLAFAFQIYADFSGYSDIAIGIARLFGIRLSQNFDCPYFSRDIAEFWRRWHKTLTGWFRDYLYIPLGGSRCGTRRKVFNVFAIFLASGIWHGANRTFIVWGAFHACLFLPLILSGRNRKWLAPPAEGRALPSPREAVGMAATFLAVLAGWTFFRAETVSRAVLWLASMAGLRGFAPPALPREAAAAAVASVAMLAAEWFNRRESFGFARLPASPIARRAIYLALAWLIVFYAPGSDSFVYFRF